MSSQTRGKRSSASATRSMDNLHEASSNGGDHSFERPTSPLSSHLKSRIQEKEQLQGLNDRLAAYIDRVRSLESENSRLSLTLSQSHEITHREVTSIKTMFQKELAETRRALDSESKDKTQYRLELDKLREDYDTLQQK